MWRHLKRAIESNSVLLMENHYMIKYQPGYFLFYSSYAGFSFPVASLQSSDPHSPRCWFPVHPSLPFCRQRIKKLPTFCFLLSLPANLRPLPLPQLLQSQTITVSCQEKCPFGIHTSLKDPLTSLTGSCQI